MDEFQNIKLWQSHGGKVMFTNEVGLPNDDSNTVPEVGAGAKRWNPTTETEQTFNGTEWVDSGSTSGSFSNNDDFAI